MIDSTVEWLQTPEGQATMTLLVAGLIVGVTGGAALVAFGPGAVLTAALVGAGAGAISGAAGVWIESQITGEKAAPQDYINAAVAGAVGGAVAGVVGMGGSALGLSPVVAGVMSGFSVGATQQATFNVVAGEAWYAGVAESAFIGAAAGGVAGGIVGAANPQSLPAKVLVGGVAGGGVGGGMKIATNVAAGRPWNEDLGQAIAIGATTGMVDAFTDHYGDKLVERAMTPRSVRGAVDDVDGWRRPGDVDDAGSMLFEPGEGKRWVNYGFEAEWHPKRLVPLDAPDGPRKVPSTGGRANEGRYRWAAGSVDAEGTKIGGRFAPGDAPEGARTRVDAADYEGVAIELGPGGLGNTARIAEARPGWEVIGVDVDASALSLERLRIRESLDFDRITLKKGDYLDPNLGVPLADEVIAMAPGSRAEHVYRAVEAAGKLVAPEGRIYVETDLPVFGEGSPHRQQIVQRLNSVLEARGLRVSHIDPPGSVTYQSIHSGGYVVQPHHNPLGIELHTWHPGNTYLYVEVSPK